MTEQASEPGLLVRDLVPYAHSLTQEDFVHQLGSYLFVAAPAGTETPQTLTFETRSRGAVQNVDSAFERYTVFPIPEGPNRAPRVVSLGRDASNDVCIPDASISRLHLRVEIESGGRVFAIDAGSRNGTLINWSALAPGQKAELNHRDALTLGSRVLRFYHTSRLYTVLTRMVIAPSLEDEDEG
jgi:hypothetical protein